MQLEECALPSSGASDRIPAWVAHDYRDAWLEERRLRKIKEQGEVKRSGTNKRSLATGFGEPQCSPIKRVRLEADTTTASMCQSEAPTTTTHRD